MSQDSDSPTTGKLRAQRSSRRQAGANPAGEPAHGWWRRGEDVQAIALARGEPENPVEVRKSTGLSFVILVAVIVCAGVAALHVHTQMRLLELAESTAELTREYDRLRDVKEQLTAERAYLRHPSRIRAQAESRLGMQPVVPSDIRYIQRKPAKANLKDQAK